MAKCQPYRFLLPPNPICRRSVEEESLDSLAPTNDTESSIFKIESYQKERMDNVDLMRRNKKCREALVFAHTHKAAVRSAIG
jgi:hypothetical protein